MTIATRHGSPQFPTISGSISPSTRDEMDAAAQVLHSHKDEWVSLPVHKRIVLLDQLIKDFAAIALRWVAACGQAKGIAADSSSIGEEWGAGTWPVLKNLRLLRQALVDIAANGGKVQKRTNELDSVKAKSCQKPP